VCDYVGNNIEAMRLITVVLDKRGSSQLSVTSTRFREGETVWRFLAPPGLIPEVDGNCSGGRENRKSCVKECLKVEKPHKTKDSRGATVSFQLPAVLFARSIKILISLRVKPEPSVDGSQINDNNFIFKYIGVLRFSWSDADSHKGVPAVRGS